MANFSETLHSSILVAFAESTGCYQMLHGKFLCSESIHSANCTVGQWNGRQIRYIAVNMSIEVQIAGTKCFISPWTDSGF